MTDDGNIKDPKLHEVLPSETAGRDTIARYQAQFRAAAYECLSILNGKTTDRVYCDYHDDFVARCKTNGKHLYHFYQVKTKGKRNHQWKLLDIFGIYTNKKQNPEKIASSFAGKLILHTIKFNNVCGNVIFLTNVQFDDSIENIASSLIAGDFSNKHLKLFVENFNEAFIQGKPLDNEHIEKQIKKLVLKPGVQYLDPHDHNFDALAREAIFEYSEIDLQHLECEEIIHSLVSLVEKKSFSKISGLEEKDLDDSAGVGIADLLEILSISKGAYQLLLDGGDPNAIKNASIIQRKLSEADASEGMIEFCSKWKVEWDIWFRDKRHFLAEFDLNFLLEDINDIKNKWITGSIQFSEIDKSIDSLWMKIEEKDLTPTLSKELLLGGVFSALVRSES